MPHASSANGTINIRPYSAVFCVSVTCFFVISFDILQTITSPVCCLCNTIYKTEAVRVVNGNWVATWEKSSKGTVGMRD